MIPEEKTYKIHFNKDKIKSVSDLSLDDLEEFINASVKSAVARMQSPYWSDRVHFTDCTLKHTLYKHNINYPSDGITLENGEIIPKYMNSIDM